MILAALIGISDGPAGPYNLPPNYVTYSNFLDFWSRCRGIRLASPSTKVEFEHYYFTNTWFSFGETSHLRAFLDNLSIHQQSLLRYIDLDITLAMNQHRMNDWMACCALLPPTLVSLQFYMCTWPWYGMKKGEEWFICWREEYPQMPMPKDLVKVVELLNVLGGSARRCAPKAKIGLDIGSFYRVRERDASEEKCVRALDEVEPWSKDWLDWWEEDRKFDKDSEEGANDIA